MGEAIGVLVEKAVRQVFQAKQETVEAPRRGWRTCGGSGRIWWNYYPTGRN